MRGAPLLLLATLAVVGPAIAHLATVQPASHKVGFDAGKLVETFATKWHDVVEPVHDFAVEALDQHSVSEVHPFGHRVRVKFEGFGRKFDLALTLNEQSVHENCTTRFKDQDTGEQVSRRPTPRTFVGHIRHRGEWVRGVVLRTGEVRLAFMWDNEIHFLQPPRFHGGSIGTKLRTLLRKAGVSMLAHRHWDKTHKDEHWEFVRRLTRISNVSSTHGRFQEEPSNGHSNLRTEPESELETMKRKLGDATMPEVFNNIIPVTSAPYGTMDSDCPSSMKYINLGMAFDTGYTKSLSGYDSWDTDVTYSEAVEAAEDDAQWSVNIMNVVYADQANVYLNLYDIDVRYETDSDDWNQEPADVEALAEDLDKDTDGCPVWTENDDTDNAPGDMLDYFTTYFRSMSDQPGILHQQTACFPPSGTVGLAYVGVTCNSYYATGWSTWYPGGNFDTLTHELGHNFGASHNFDDGGIMDYESPVESAFFGDSQTSICSHIDDEVNDCYSSYSATCGNGIVEPGEECDDSTDCCDLTDCTLASGAVCSYGTNSDCCTTSCTYEYSDTACSLSQTTGYCVNGECRQPWGLAIGYFGFSTDATFACGKSSDPCTEYFTYSGSCYSSQYLSGGPYYVPEGTYCAADTVCDGAGSCSEAAPTSAPTEGLSDAPTTTPTLSPSPEPTVLPTLLPTSSPTASPSLDPTVSPTAFIHPTRLPTVSFHPTSDPSSLPTALPSTAPPTLPPSENPTGVPTGAPTASPTSSPSNSPSAFPTSHIHPTRFPTVSLLPSNVPSDAPTGAPSAEPTTSPTGGVSPSVMPTIPPTEAIHPTPLPTVSPRPSSTPSAAPTPAPSPGPTFSATEFAVTTPSAGEIVYNTDSVRIMWSSDGPVTSTVSIYLLKANSVVDTIASGITNVNYYDWAISGRVPSHNFQVRVVSDSGSVAGDSNYFTIEDHVAFNWTSPTAGDILETGTNLTLTWDYAGDVASISIVLHDESGAEAFAVATDETNLGYLKWVVPCSLVAGNYSLVLQGTDGASVVRSRSGNLTVVAGPTDTPLVFFELETDTYVEAGQPFRLLWTSPSDVSDVTLALSNEYSDLGFNTTTITSGNNENGLTATIPANLTAGNGYRFLLTSGATTVTSNNVVVVSTQPRVSVSDLFSGQVGDLWRKGTDATIDFTVTGPVDSVTIQVYNSSRLVATAAEYHGVSGASSSYTYRVPCAGDPPVGDDYYVQVTSDLHPDIATTIYSVLFPIYNAGSSYFLDSANDDAACSDDDATAFPQADDDTGSKYGLTMTAPATGASWDKGADKRVAWEWTDDVPDDATLQIQLFKGNSSRRTIFGDWCVPHVDSAGTYHAACVNDPFDSSYEECATAVDVNSLWTDGGICADFADHFRLIDSVTVDAATAEDGQYLWSVEDLASMLPQVGDEYVFRVVMRNESTVYAQSSSFTVSWPAVLLDFGLELTSDDLDSAAQDQLCAEVAGLLNIDSDRVVVSDVGDTTNATDRRRLSATYTVVTLEIGSTSDSTADSAADSADTFLDMWSNTSSELYSTGDYLSLTVDETVYAATATTVDTSDDLVATGDNDNDAGGDDESSGDDDLIEKILPIAIAVAAVAVLTGIGAGLYGVFCRTSREVAGYRASETEMSPTTVTSAMAPVIVDPDREKVMEVMAHHEKSTHGVV